MKRILIFTLVIVISFHISAAETVLGSSVLPISLNLSEGGVSYIEVGFSYNQISHFSDKVDFAVKEKHNITVKEDGSSSESDDDIYVYWKILSANSVSADLMVPSALKNDEEQIDWMIALQTGESIGYGEYSDLLRVLSPTSKFVTVGSHKLDINTIELKERDVVPGEYTGELKLNISID